MPSKATGKSSGPSADLVRRLVAASERFLAAFTEDCSWRERSEAAEELRGVLGEVRG